MNKISFRKVILFLVVCASLTIGLVVYAQQTTDQKTERLCPLTNKHSDDSNLPENCPLIKKPASQTTDANTDAVSEHHQTVLENGEKEMGFSQTATTHHFLIMNDGGAIQVETKDASDTVNRDKIRTHLTEIAKLFQNGDFTTPFAVHSQIPPGAPEMEKLKNEISYSYEETVNGAQVRIKTGNPQALAAIHQFLKFQIEDHQTGDPTTVRIVAAGKNDETLVF